MRLFRIFLAALLILVTALYGLTGFREKTSGKNVGPTISCPQEVLELSVTDSSDALLTGITASDKQDGNLTDHILIQGMSRQITDNVTSVTYLVFDSDGNSASASRSIHYTDYVSPRFTVSESLVYSSTASIGLLDRLGAVDCLDGDVTNSIRVSTLLETADPEIYTVDVQVTNSFSDTARLTLPIVIYSTSAPRPVITLSEYLIYLNRGASFNPNRYLQSVEDNRGELLSTGDIRMESNINTAVPGTYTVTYRYPYEGTTALAVLTVVVE